MEINGYVLAGLFLKGVIIISLQMKSLHMINYEITGIIVGNRSV